MYIFLFYFCLSLIVILLVLENIGFLFRIAGLKVNNLVAGYTFQNSWSFASRFFTLLFAPIFAFLADTNNININFLHIIYFYFLLFTLILFCNLRIKSLVDILSEIINFQQKGNSIIRSIFRKPVITSTIKIFFWDVDNYLQKKKYYLPKKVKNSLLLFNFTYILFYACWPIISILITNFPDKPSLLISTSTYFTLSSTVYQSISFDPMISRYSEDKETTKTVYILLQKYRLISVIFSFILTTIIFIMFKIF